MRQLPGCKKHLEGAEEGVHHRGRKSTEYETKIWFYSCTFAAFRVFSGCCPSTGDDPHLTGQLLRVVAYGVVPFLYFDFSKGIFPEITG